MDELETSVYFIKRTDVETTFKDLLKSKQKVIGDIEGPFGIGKTTTIDFLYQIALNDPNLVAVKVDIDDLVGLEVAEALERPPTQNIESPAEKNYSGKID